MVGGAVVKARQPVSQKIGASGVVAPFEVNVGYRMGGHGVGGTLLQRALRQLQGVVEQAVFVVGEGVLPLEGPVIAVLRRHALHQSKKLLGIVGDTGACVAAP